MPVRHKNPLNRRAHDASAVLTLVLILGLALAAIALLLVSSHASTGTRVASALTGALAGGLIGASISTFVTAKYDTPVLDQVRSLLEGSAESRVTCPEEHLAHLRTVWHHYHSTLVNNTPVWRYSVMPFDNHATVGALTADVPVVDGTGDGRHHTYKLTAAVWSRRVVLLHTRVKGDEAAGVAVFPDMAGFRRVHAGVAVMHSWSNSDVLAPVLVSNAPLVDVAAPGSITAAPAVEALEALWIEHFAHVEVLLPSRGTGGARRDPPPPGGAGEPYGGVSE